MGVAAGLLDSLDLRNVEGSLSYMWALFYSCFVIFRFASGIGNTWNFPELYTSCTPIHTHPLQPWDDWVVCWVCISLRHLVMPHSYLEVGALLLAPALGLSYFGSWVIPAGNWKEEGIRSFPFSFHCHTHIHHVKWGHLLLIEPLFHSGI